jgi:molybdopterin biosynthesis enzyme MoaB
MFYTMKLAVLFVMASIILVGSTIAIASPNAVHAVKPNAVFCVEGNTAACKDTMKECRAIIGSIADAKKCERVVLS